MADRSVSGGKAAKGRRRLGRGLDALMASSAPVSVSPEKGAGAEKAADSAGAGASGGAVESSNRGTERARAGGGDGAASEVPGVGGLRMIAVGAVSVSPFQPRSEMDEEELEQLSASIRRSGVMQPVLVRPRSGDGGGDSFELIAGERRWRAAQRAGLVELPALVRDIDDETAAEWALVENIQRSDLNPIEEAAALKNLMDRFGLTQAELAERTGKDRSSVANLVRLMDLEEEVRELIASGDLSTGHGKVLLAMSPGMLRAKLAARASSERMSVRQLEQAIKSSARETVGGAGSGGGASSAEVVRDAAREAQRVEVEALEKRLGEHLGTKVKITVGAKGKAGKIELVYFDLDHFDGLMSRMGFSGWGEEG